MSCHLLKLQKTTTVYKVPLVFTAVSVLIFVTPFSIKVPNIRSKLRNEIWPLSCGTKFQNVLGRCLDGILTQRTKVKARNWYTYRERIKIDLRRHQ